LFKALCYCEDIKVQYIPIQIFLESQMYTDLFRLFKTKVAATEGPTGLRYTLQKMFDMFVSKSGVKTLRDYGDKWSTMISGILKQMQLSKNYLVQNLQRFCVEMDPMRSKCYVTMILEQTTADQQGKQLQQSENTNNWSKQQQTNKGSNYNIRKIQTIGTHNSRPTREATGNYNLSDQQ
jgi:hypothetical protein